jgi:chlorite dismutase
MQMSDVRGPGLVPRLQVVNGAADAPQGSVAWVLQGLTSNVRYATRDEVDALKARQPVLDRPQATCAALIPIKKSAQWWELAQDERRAIFEQSSRHTAIGLEYLPAVARRLHHCRDIGEPFDFLTWFEYAPSDTGAFDELVERLRTSPEWEYVEREVDIRVQRVDASRHT